MPLKHTPCKAELCFQETQQKKDFRSEQVEHACRGNFKALKMEIPLVGSSVTSPAVPPLLAAGTSQIFGTFVGVGADVVKTYKKTL